MKKDYTYLLELSSQLLCPLHHALKMRLNYAIATRIIWSWMYAYFPADLTIQGD